MLHVVVGSFGLDPSRSDVRLTPYMRPFKTTGSEHHFIKGAGFRDLSNLYAFDRRLRLLVMDAIEGVEVAARVMISNYMGPKYGSHWYLDRSLFKSNYKHEQLLQIVGGKQQIVVVRKLILEVQTKAPLRHTKSE